MNPVRNYGFRCHGYSRLERPLDRAQTCVVARDLRPDDLNLHPEFLVLTNLDLLGVYSSWRDGGE